MNVILLAKSSTGDPYKVEFVHDQYLRVFCHCQAGVLRQVCKHKLALLKGDVEMLFDRHQANLLTEIQNSPKFHSLKTKLEEFESALKTIQSERDSLAKREKFLKATFAQGLFFGFEEKGK